MATAFQSSAFQDTAFQIDVSTTAPVIGTLQVFGDFSLSVSSQVGEPFELRVPSHEFDLKVRHLTVAT